MQEALNSVAERLTQFFDSPTFNVSVLNEACLELHRIQGVLRMIRLEGVAVYCDELERALAELSANPGLNSALYRSVLQSATSALNDYLNELMKGAHNAALRLFPHYEAVQHLRGMEMSFEQDLFFPNLDLPLPDTLLNLIQPDNAPESIKTSHKQYQRGLMLWLRNKTETDTVPMMQLALDNILTCSPENEGRAFWWVANGLLDCMRMGKLTADIRVQKLLGLIERKMRAVNDITTANVQTALNEMLYMIGCCQSATARTEHIRSHYELERYLPEHKGLPGIRQSCGQLREHMREAEKNWEHCTEGDNEACNKFIGQLEKIAHANDQIEHNPAQYLARKLEKFADTLRDTEYARLAAENIAMALLLWHNDMAQCEGADMQFQKHSHTLFDHIDAAINQRPEDTRQLISAYKLTEQDNVVTSLSREMLENLQLVEQGLNAFFSNTENRDELPRLHQLIVQIRGGLHILSLLVAEKLLLEIQNVVLRFAESVPKPTETQTLALAVSALHEYFQILMRGQQNNTTALHAALNALLEFHEPVAGTSIETPSSTRENQELLDIFLEEANEVLCIMRSNIEIHHLHPENPEPLLTIRRGFHTLKGSGRMVNLNELAEVAWTAERTLQLQDGKSASPALLRFITDAVHAFEKWVNELEKHGHASISADYLTEQALKIDAGITVIQPTVEAIEDTEKPIKLGSARIPPALFRIASEEASQNILALRRQFEAMLAISPKLVQYDFMRAAHTLAGVGQNLAAMPIVNLASALENWLQARIDTTASISDQQVQMLEESIVVLDEMVQHICSRRFPDENGELVNRLLIDRVITETNEAEQSAALPSPTSDIGTNAKDDANPANPTEVNADSSADESPKHSQAREQPAILRDDVDEQLLPVFLQEADELCGSIGRCLRLLREMPEKDPQQLNRLLHTLKGSARMTGAMRIGGIAHAMEGLLLGEVNTALCDALENDFDRINILLEELRSGKTHNDDAEHKEDSQDISDAPYHAVAERSINMLRVRSDVIDWLFNQAGEISVTRSRMETELRAFKEGLLELTGSVTRLRKQLREVEIQAESQMQARVSSSSEKNEQFDPLEFDRFTRLQELTRFMNESVHDVQTVQQSLLKNIDETNSAMFAQTRLNRELQQNLMSVRMVPFGSMSERLYRLVRQTAKELNKRANLELTGTAVELDRSVLEKMTAPFEHLLRNAIAHGLESEQQRVNCGKDAIGEVRLNLYQENNEVVFEFSDDGRGLDFAALRGHAVSKGLISATDDTVSEDQLAQLIFVSGVSTADEVTEVAGRGVGMDVVRSEITAMGGRIDVNSRTGQGTRFTIHLPLTLALTHVLIVRSDDTLYAIPSTMVEQVRQVKSAALQALYTENKVEWQDKVHPLHYLPRLLDDSEHSPESQPYNPVLLLRSGSQRIALHVDEMRGNHEVVVKNIGPQLARLPGITGATVLGNGKTVLIINPVQMAQRIASRKIHKTAPIALRVLPMVMVVDDSLTVRKITTRMLSRAGYQVVTAKDGVDALEKLSETTPDVMLLDVEMPRMDGFELTRLLRRDAQTKNMPIIMITSRTADKHRDHALKLGVNIYLGKPYQDDTLLELIAGFVGAQDSPVPQP